MERMPIVSEKPQNTEQGVAIKLVESPLTIRNMLPAYYYQFQAGDIPEEAKKMYENLVDFLVTNEELAVNEPVISREDYIKGFQKALAMTRLWIDSIYLQKPEK